MSPLVVAKIVIESRKISAASPTITYFSHVIAVTVGKGRSRTIIYVNFIHIPVEISLVEVSSVEVSSVAVVGEIVVEGIDGTVFGVV